MVIYSGWFKIRAKIQWKTQQQHNLDHLQNSDFASSSPKSEWKARSNTWSQVIRTVVPCQQGVRVSGSDWSLMIIHRIVPQICPPGRWPERLMVESVCLSLESILSDAITPLGLFGALRGLQRTNSKTVMNQICTTECSRRLLLCLMD